MSYYESYLDEDLLNEDLLESYGENFDESRSNRRTFSRINPSVSPGVRQRSNFGNSLSGKSADYATKSDLKKSLDSISKDVNELKTTTIATNKALVSLDAKHSELAKIDARKGENQTKVLKNMQMMNMMSSLLNQPKLKVENLQIIPAVAANTGTGAIAVPATIGVVPGKNPIEVDMTMSLILPMLTTIGDSGSGKSSDSMNMMLPMILLMNKDSSSNNMLPLVLMMTMMNK
jgi:hypothetical protein